ncbi:hypothetical protein ACTXT7_011032 [Hymenolepis weldensis]
MHRTTPHPALNDRSPAKTPTKQERWKIHNVLLPKESTFSSSSSCSKKTLATGRTVCVRDYRPDDTWAAGIVRTWRSFGLYEVNSIGKFMCVIGIISVFGYQLNY